MQPIEKYGRSYLGRLTAVVALLAAALFITSIFLGPGSVIHGRTSTDAALAYVSQHGQAIRLLGFMDGLLNTLLAVVVVLLVGILAGEGILANLAYTAAGAAAALQWAHAGMLYALAELGQRGGADAGVMALFTLGSTMDDSDGIVIPLALACVGGLALRSGRAPAVIGWLSLGVAGVGTAVALIHLLGTDLGPVSVISGWIWLIGIGVTLLVKPVSDKSRAEVRSAATV